MGAHLQSAPLGLLETLPSPSAIFDRDRQQIAANTKWLDQIGPAPQSHQSAADVVFDLGTKMPDWPELHRRALDGETTTLTCKPVLRSGGATDYVDWLVAPWKSAGGSALGVVVHANLVTEQAHIRQRLDEEEAFIRTLFEGAPIGMNLCRMDGLWLESNPAFLDIIGYSREEADGGLTYWDLTPSYYAADEQAQLARLEKDGRYGPYEKEFIRKDGDKLPVRLNGFIVERGGERFIWSLIEDLTEQHRLRDELERQTLKAIQASKMAAIGEMAAGIAHEINNPLQLIDALAYQGERALDNEEEISVELFGGIRTATARASHIVRGLLDFSREHRGDVGAHDVERIAKEALSYTAARMRSHGVDVTCHVETEGTVRCGFVETTQVLVNLLNNSFDAVAAPGGEVALRIERCDDDVCFDVMDNGPGVEEDLIDRLFDPFVTTKPQGTGLGLSISRGLVEAMGGTLTYTRKNDVSHFVVQLPAGSEE